jgi:hypothetical protein
MHALAVLLVLVVQAPDSPLDDAPPATKEVAFVDASRPSLGVTARAGLHHYGFQGGADLLFRWHGLTVGTGWSHLGGGPGQTQRTELVGLEGGYTLTLDAWRIGLLGEWGWSHITMQPGSSFGESGSSAHYAGAQLGLDRALTGSRNWTASVGLGVFVRRQTTELGTGFSGYDDYGGGIRLSADWRL